MGRQQLGIYLPLIYPPKVPIDLPGGVVREVSDDELESQFGENLSGEGLMVFELRLLRMRRRQGSHVIFERTGPGPTDESFLALLDLLSGDWRHRFHVPMPTRYLRGVMRPRAVRMRHLTPPLVTRLATAIQFLAKTPRLEIALHRWGASYKRANPLESVLDCCAALEAVAQSESELRLRLALTVGDLLPRRKRDARRIVYRLYGIRSKFVHGASLPSVSRDESEELVGVTAAVLKEVIHVRRLPKPLDEVRLLAM